MSQLTSCRHGSSRNGSVLVMYKRIRWIIYKSFGTNIILLKYVVHFFVGNTSSNYIIPLHIRFFLEYHPSFN